MDYQIGQEATYKGKEAIIKKSYQNGWLQIEVGGKLKDVYYDEIQAKPLEKINFLGRQTYAVPGFRSNLEIQRRNGGVRHQFQDSIGGCSSNYR